MALLESARLNPPAMEAAAPRHGRDFPAAGGRLLSLDIFRGLTVAGMIVVNSPGNRRAYSLLEHADWNGCTLADLVFPFFLFIVGASLVFSLSKRKQGPGSPRRPLSPILKRTAVIFGLGLFLNAIPNYHPSTFRLPGVLQRIALCYLACSLLFLRTSLRSQGLLAGLILAGYWLVMTRVPAPGFGVGELSKAGNLAAYLDRLLLGRHIYVPGVYDPEGILSTFPAIATCLLGMFCGRWLLSGRPPAAKAGGMALAGAACVIAGRLWAGRFPINKALWTSSYVLHSGGLALIVLAACYWLADVQAWRAWGKPFEAFGTNAIAAYVLPILLLKAIVYTNVAGPAGATQTRLWLCGGLFEGWLSPLNASAAFAFSYMALWMGVFGVLYRKRIFFKV